MTFFYLVLFLLVSLPTSSASDAFDPQPYLSTPDKSVVCHINAIREIDWQVPKIELPFVAYLAFIAAVASISILGISFTAQGHMTALALRWFRISGAVLLVGCALFSLLALRELQMHPPVIVEPPAPVQRLADATIVTAGPHSPLTGVESITFDLTHYPGRFQSEVRAGDDVRLWTTSMNKEGICLPEYFEVIKKTN